MEPMHYIQTERDVVGNEDGFLKFLVNTRQAGITKGVWSICSAHRLVIEAAALQAIADNNLLLIESTSNQVNQFGGYTGMKPADFQSFVHSVVAEAGLDVRRVLLGGDHLGPAPWSDLSAKNAMSRAETMVAAYAAAGFKKFHLDTSMGCSDDPPQLMDETIAIRAAHLCSIIESNSESNTPYYVIGTDVPKPGGTSIYDHKMKPSDAEAVLKTIEIHRQAFLARGLVDAWSRVVAVVAHPGADFSATSIINYDHKASSLLTKVLEKEPQLIFEAHSTDFQSADALFNLVSDGFAILKVGPALTFAMREAFIALECIERLIVPSFRRSHLTKVLEEAMLKDNKYWISHYSGSRSEVAWMRIYGYSDRIRYYWSVPTVVVAVDKLMNNLSSIDIPKTLLSQYMPMQYCCVLEGRLTLDPRELVLSAIRSALKPYVVACVQRSNNQGSEPSV